MGGAKAAAGLGLALAFGLAACGMWHENIYPHFDAVVVIPPAPPPIDAPADMPAFDHAPLTPQALMAHVQRLASDQFEGGCTYRGPMGVSSSMTPSVSLSVHMSYPPEETTHSAFTS